MLLVNIIQDFCGLHPHQTEKEAYLKFTNLIYLVVNLILYSSVSHVNIERYKNFM